MSVAQINSHVLLPNYPDWRKPVRRDRVWLTTVDRALTGAEERLAMRPKPRERISYRIESQTADELARMLARIEAAMKAGLACAPYWGRGIQLVSAVGDSVTLSRTAWAGVGAGSWVLIGEREDGETFETAEVLYVQDTLVRLSGDLVVDRGTDSWAWPLMFGRPTFGEIEHRTDYHASVTVTLSEISIRPDPQVVVDICFIDPNGGMESWRNVLSQSWPYVVGGFTFISYSCLYEWNADVDGTSNAVEGWQAVATFTNETASCSISGSPELWNMPDDPPHLDEWQCASDAVRGAWDSWANLSSGDPGSSWTGELNDLAPDDPLGGLAIWAASEYL